MSITLEVGKTYKTRDGRLAEVVYHNKNSGSINECFVLAVESYTNRGMKMIRCCTPDGRAHRNAKSNRDLIAE